MDALPPPKRKNRSGSEKRQKQRRITFRLTADEYAFLEDAAGGQALTLGCYIRERMLKAPTMKRTRRPPVEVVALARAMGQLSKVGSNIHQLLKRVNYGEFPNPEEYRDALTGHKEAISALMETLGRGSK